MSTITDNDLKDLINSKFESFDKRFESLENKIESYFLFRKYLIIFIFS